MTLDSGSRMVASRSVRSSGGSGWSTGPTKVTPGSIPESSFVDDVNLARYTGYTRNRSTWQIVDALDTINLPARPAPVRECPSTRTHQIQDHLRYTFWVPKRLIDDHRSTLTLLNDHVP